VIITTSDGHVFQCSRTAFPRNPNAGAIAEMRWILTEESGTEHVGPRALSACSLEELQPVVETWWARSKASRTAEMKMALDRARPQRSGEE
jgi:hypothetical protein